MAILTTKEAIEKSPHNLNNKNFNQQNLNKKSKILTKFNQN